MMHTAGILQADIQTVSNWENGSCKIPYAAYHLMRMQGSYVLFGKSSEGFTLLDRKLFTPTGRSFEPNELQYGFYCASFIKLAKP